jgi:hypothetical protein
MNSSASREQTRVLVDGHARSPLELAADSPPGCSSADCGSHVDRAKTEDGTERAPFRSNGQLDSMDGDLFARTVFDLALKIENDERQIKLSLLNAVESGRTDQAKTILERWLRGPVTSVLERCETGPEPGTTRQTCRDDRKPC